MWHFFVGVLFYVSFAEVLQISFISEGKVVKLSERSIHVIVLGFSSASILEEDIREELRYKTVSTSSL